MAVAEKIKKKSDVEKVVEVLLAKANKPDTQPKPYCGGEVNPEEIEKLTMQIKKEHAKKTKLKTA